MLFRTRIVQCRLTPKEIEQFAPLVQHTFEKTWSCLIRRALLHLWKDELAEPSDNGVIHRKPQTNKRQAKPSVVAKRYRPSLPAAKKTGV